MNKKTVEFDPAKRAHLSDEQIHRMEQILIAVRCLKDESGLLVRYDMNYWVAAQLAAALFYPDGGARKEVKV